MLVLVFCAFFCLLLFRRIGGSYSLSFLDAAAAGAVFPISVSDITTQELWFFEIRNEYQLEKKKLVISIKGAFFLP